MRTSLLLDMVADTVPDRIAFGAGAGEITYSSLRARAIAAASALVTTGAERVAYVGLNANDLPVAFFASAHMGAPFAPLNYRLPDADLRRLLERTAPAVAVVDEDMRARLGGVRGVSLVSSAALGEDTAPACVEDKAADIAVLLFTSGTTGEPKAAVLRHQHLTSYVLSSVEFLSAGEDEAALVSVPSYHIAGISAILTNVFAGRRVVYLPAFTPEAWVDTAARERISHAMVVPTMLGRILDVLALRGETLPHLRALSYGGGRMPEPVITRALELMPQVDFVNAYGLTETSSTIAVLGPEDHRAAFASADANTRRRLGSVGRPLPSIELEIRDGNNCCVAPGVAGEIHVRGEQVAGEYLDAKAIAADGWFATKDSGWLDDEGYLFVEGRLDDVIVRGGENISPGEIEDVLRAHPAIADVAVLGLPDNEWGERVAAVIVPRADAPSMTDLAVYVKARLRSTKAPETWVVRDALPYNDTGKLLRRVLRAELESG